MPIYTVQKTYFREMLRILDPRYQVPSRNHFRNVAIPKLFSEIRERVEAELQEAQYFSATTDMWSSTGMTPYLGFTVHFINKKWKLISRSLETLFFPSDHTADNIAEELTEALDSWSLKSEMLTCITTDNGANIISACKGVLSWPRISCFGHNLNLAITNSYKKDTRVTRALSVCRTIVSAFGYSWKRKRELTRIQEELGLPKHQLKADCCTRWGSAHAMTSRFLEQEDAIRKVLSEDRKCSHLIPRYNDVQILEAIKAAFDPVAEFTDILGAENYVTISTVKPLLFLLETKILVSDNDTQKLTSTLKHKIRDYMCDKYSDTKTQELLCFATYVDPRFKNEHLSTEECDRVRSAIRNNRSMHVRNKASDIQTSSSTETEPAIQTPKKQTFASLLATAKPGVNSDNNDMPELVNTINKQIATYESLSCIESGQDPLDWWRINCENFPTIAQYARKYLCICATSVPSERLFSLAGSIVTNKRTLLKPEMVNMLTFIAANMNASF